MKIAVTSQGPFLESKLDGRFGRATYFLIVDTKTMDFEAIKNPHVDAPSGAGIQAASLVADKRAKVLFTGHCGPKATDALKAAKIEIIEVIDRPAIKEVVEHFKSTC